MPINSLLADLNKQQVSAATLGRQHALVLAGAGCGKTRTIIARAAYLISQGTPPQRIQILTFTRRAAAEIVERVRLHLGDAADGLHASTFHTWCISLIRRAPHVFGCKGYSVIDRDDQLQLFKLLRGKQSKSTLPTAAQLCDLYSYTRNTCSTLLNTLKLKAPESYEQKARIGEIMQGYDAKKKERQYLDYDDILDVVGQSIASSPNIAAWVAQQYDHLLVDEMQDTNPLQWKLLDPLRHQVTLFCVGDDAQSIYGFRGADFRNVHSFSDRVPESITLRLEQNYRSTQEILDAANWLLDESPLNYEKRLIADRGAGLLPRIHTFHNEWEEGRWVADDLTIRRAAGADWRQHMILVRSSFAARTVESALLARNIPYRFVGGTKLMESAHVRDLLSVLRIVGNQRDEIAWMRFLTLWPGFGEVSANRLVEKILVQDSLEACVDIIKGAPKLPTVASDVILRVKALQNEVGKAVSAALVDLNELLKSRYQNQQWDSRKRDFPLVERVAEKHSSILGFIEEYLLDPVHASLVRTKENDDVVTVITIHSAKGTECDVCYVVNVSPGSYPITAAIGDVDEVEEERRVLYVAMTRAKNDLIVTRQNNSVWAYQPPSDPDSGKHEITSYFLNALPDGLFLEENHSSRNQGAVSEFAGTLKQLSVGIDLGFSANEVIKQNTNFYVDNGNGTVTDRRTKLTWLRCAMGQVWDGQSVVGEASVYTWDTAVHLKFEFAGFNDWRLPTRQELSSIIALGQTPICIDLVAFPNASWRDFWTSSTLPGHDEYKYQVSFHDGGERLRFASHANAVRLVRGNYDRREPIPNIVDHGDGTISDPRTALRWMRCVVGQTWDGKKGVGEPSLFSWDEAQLVQHTFAGFADWRLPDADELSSFAWSPEPTLNSGEVAFPNPPKHNLWSSTLYKGIHGYNVNHCGAAFPTNRTAKLALRLVRSSPTSVTLSDPNISVPENPIRAQLAAHFTDHGDGTLTDKRTGLMWMRSVLGITWDAKPTDKREFADPFTWAAACEIKHLFAGHADWRVPTIDELISIIDLGRHRPAIDIEAFPNTPSSCFWTSTARVGDNSAAWYVNFLLGSAETTSGLSLHFPVRLVRRETPLRPYEQKLFKNQNGTVCDVSTGLMWMRCAIGQVWNGSEFIGGPHAFKWGEVDKIPIDFYGYNDWRLPTVYELNTIIDRKRIGPVIDTTIFQNKICGIGGWSGQWYWTANRAVGLESSINAIDLYSGSICALDIETDIPNYVRLVRGELMNNRPEVT